MIDFNDIYDAAEKTSLLAYVTIDGGSISLAPPCPYVEGESAFRIFIGEDERCYLNGEVYDGSASDLADACKTYRSNLARLACTHYLRAA
jgi:hypothetical protein